MGSLLCLKSSSKLFTTSALLFFMVSLFSVSFVLLSGSSASAAPPPLKTSTLSLISKDGSKNQNVANGADESWSDIIANDHFYTSSYTLCDLSEIKSIISTGYGSLSVSQYRQRDFQYPDYMTNSNLASSGLGYGQENDALGVLIFYSQPSETYPDAPLQYADQTEYDTYVSLQAYGTPTPSSPYRLGWVFLSMSNSGDVRLDCDSSSRSSSFLNYLTTVSWADPYPMWNGTSYTPSKNIYLYFSNFLTIYSSAWTGDDLPVSPPSSFNNIPDLSATFLSDRTWQISDSQFLSVDSPSFLCADDTVPMINYELWFGIDPENQEKLTTGTFPSNGFLTYQVPRNLAGDFRVVGWYSCPDSSVVFHGSSYVDFNVDPYEYDMSVPDLRVVSMVGFNVTIQDLNFNTFDPVPFLCDDDLTPVMYYELYENAGGNPEHLVASGVVSPTVPFVRQLKKSAENYVFIAWYSCGTGDSHEFGSQSRLYFKANQFGSLIRDCNGDSFDALLCKMSQSVNIGIFSSTFNGLTNVLYATQQISPDYCTDNFTSSMSFTNQYIKVQDIPEKLCDFANANYVQSGTPFHTITTWLNVAFSGASVLLLVFGIMSALGFKVRLSSPLSEEADEDSSSVRPDIPTSPSISRHRGTYSSGQTNRRSTDVTFSAGYSGKWHDTKPERWRD